MKANIKFLECNKKSNLFTQSQTPELGSKNTLCMVHNCPHKLT